MIYYFSGTGNSEAVAEKLAEYTKDDFRFIPDETAAMDGDAIIETAAGEVVGIVCPIYAWGVPECVVDFMKHIKVDKKAFAYIVVTCASDAGKAVRQVERIFPFNSAYSVRMPENCTALFKTDSEELTREKINVARQLLPRIAQSINARTDTYDVKEGWEGALKTCVINPLFSLLFMRTQRFRVADDCTGCGECARVCPFGIIEVADGKPHWQSTRCQMCMKCVMHCPTRALSLGASARHDVYLFPKNLMKRGFAEGVVVHEKTAAQSSPSPIGTPQVQGESTILAGSDMPPQTLHSGGDTPSAIATALQEVEQMERLLSSLKSTLKALEG